MLPLGKVAPKILCDFLGTMGPWGKSFRFSVNRRSIPMICRWAARGPVGLLARSVAKSVVGNRRVTVVHGKIGLIWSSFRYNRPTATLQRGPKKKPQRLRCGQSSPHHSLVLTRFCEARRLSSPKSPAQQKTSSPGKSASSPPVRSGRFATAQLLPALEPQPRRS